VSRGESGHERVVAGRAQLRKKGQLTLPPRVRAALHLSEGDEVEFTVHPDGEVTLRGLTVIPTAQKWFWTEEWQAGEREASAAIVAGKLHRGVPRRARRARCQSLMPTCERHRRFDRDFQKDGHATFEYGKEQREGEPHIVWRRVGTHSIFKDP
jgi:AbrB family looped-hinge helix DNA binding protein